MKKSRLSFARYNPLKRRQQRKQIALAVSIGLGALFIGGPLLEGKYGRGLVQSTLSCLFQQEKPLTSDKKSNTSVLSLISHKHSRKEQLEAIASGPKSLNTSRARYLLASDLIQRRQGQKALALLKGLECDYPVMGEYIARQRAAAYEVMGNQSLAKASWQALLKRYPDSPVAAEALVALDKTTPKDWKVALAKFPSHPLTLKRVGAWLQKKPNQPEFMVLLAKYDSDGPKVSTLLDKLVDLPERINGRRVDALKPEDWEAIAFGYWKERKYYQASTAYRKATSTPRNAYLAGRSLQLAGKPAAAINVYKEMVQEFPNTRETASSLLQLGKLQPTLEGLPYLNRVIRQFPERAGEAMLIKAETLDQLNNIKGAAQTRELLLTKYGHSDAAAEYRWMMARTKARSRDFKAALAWAKPIIQQNPNSELARQAGFWVGKWAKRLGQPQEATSAFEYVLTRYPQSYYAWRSAVALGLDVKDFTTVRQISPQVVRPTERSLLPAGSATLKELYQLGQDKEAWTLWQAEFQNRLKPTVAEQFTDGLLRQTSGDHLQGITQVAKLEDRDTPEEKAQYEDLKRRPIYWHALYPFPFLELIETWSKQRQLNPLLVTALIRQESRFMPTIRSSANAVGLMQVVPETATSVAKRINLKRYALDNPNDNVNLGTWILEETHQHYKNNSLLAVASYNAGPSKVTTWLEQKESADSDEFIEAIPYEETKDYVKQVFGNYWNYVRLYNPQVGQQVAKYSISQPISQPITLRP